MKKTPPASKRPAVQPPRLWRNLALVLGASTLGLVVLLMRVSSALDTLAAQVDTPASAPATDALPRALVPYAALGSNMAENNRIADLGWTPAQFDAFITGMRSSYAGRGVPMNEDATKLRDELSRRVQSMLESEHPDPLETYFRMLRETESVSRTPSGLHYRITEPGEGEPPRPDDVVVLSLIVQLPDGTKLPELTMNRSRMTVRDLLPGLAEGLGLMRVGGKALVYLTPALGFGSRPPASIPPDTPVVCFVELHDILPPEPVAE